jgi:uncharacterized protein YcbK (DUF882 family)
MDTIFLILLDRLRDLVDGPVNVSSGFRCNTHNKEIGGVDNSWHTKGKAADIYSSKATLKEIYDIAIKMFDEVIIYNKNGFVHVAEPNKFYSEILTSIVSEDMSE